MSPTPPSKRPLIEIMSDETAETFRRSRRGAGIGLGWLLFLALGAWAAVIALLSAAVWLLPVGG